MKYIYIVSLALLFNACSNIKVDVKTDIVLEDENVSVEVIQRKVVKDIPNEKLVVLDKNIEIYDLKYIPQNVEYFTKNISNSAEKFDIQTKYEGEYFSIWNMDKPTEDLDTVKWPFYLYKPETSYEENFHPLKQEFFDEMLKNSNFTAYATINKNALTLKETNLRALPTLKPLLLDPTLAGEGFPFDYLQNSTIHANKPVFISHYSKDREWAYIFSSFTSGWVKTSEVVVLNKIYSDMWQEAKQVQIIKEDIPIYAPNGDFLFKSKLGMMFALIDEDEKSYTILATSSYKGSEALFLKAKISKDIANVGFMDLNTENLNKIVNEVSKTNYGWGGIYEQRDCSSMLRDMFAPFGIWLPRNSYQQSKIGEVIIFNGMSDEEKIKLIKEKAIPFQTLLYKKGRIVLYVGTYEDEVVVFNNTWGIKTKKDDIEGRIVIGKPVFSTLKLGKNQVNYDEEAEILRNLRSMNIITKHNP